MSNKINTDKAPKPMGLYPHARKVGNLLFLSGVGPRAVFDNVKVILEESGSSWDKIVDVTTFLTDMKRDFKTYNRVYAEYFKDNQPCRTTVEVNALPSPISIELKCIASID